MPWQYTGILVDGSRVILVMCKNCSDISWHQLLNQSKANCPKNLNSDGLIVREMGPWPKCIFRSLLQFLVSSCFLMENGHWCNLMFDMITVNVYFRFFVISLLFIVTFSHISLCYIFCLVFEFEIRILYMCLCLGSDFLAEVLTSEWVSLGLCHSFILWSLMWEFIVNQ